MTPNVTAVLRLRVLGLSLKRCLVLVQRGESRRWVPPGRKIFSPDTIKTGIVPVICSSGG